MAMSALLSKAPRPRYRAWRRQRRCSQRTRTLHAFERKRQIQSVDERIRQTPHFADGGNPLQQNGELVAAEPRYGIRGRVVLDDPLRDRLQQTVAGIMTERIVDVLGSYRGPEQSPRTETLPELGQGERVLHTIPE